MEICSHRHLWGPNAWAGVPVLDVSVRCTGRRDADTVRRVAATIDAALPERAATFGPFAATPGECPDQLRLLAEVALALQGVARPPETRFHGILPTADGSLFRVAIEAPDPTLAAECLRRAAAIIEDAAGTGPLDLAECRDDLVDVADDACVGPSTMLMVRAAEARGIPWQRIGDQSLVQLGQGARQRRIWTAETDRTSAIAESISRNKQLTKRLIAAAGVPVPRGRVVDSAAEAWEAAEWIGGPFVLKPLDGNHGRGVFLNLTTRAEVEQSYPVAADEGRSSDLVVVEEYVKGVEHRLLVVGGRVRACAKGEYVYVTGDGQSTVAALIDSQVNSNDPRRGSSESMPNKTVKLDSVVLTELAQQRMAPDTVPDRGQRVLVKRLGTHGPDVLPKVHPEIAAAAVRAARAVGLDVAGIDLVAQDISRPLHEQGAKVCEVNAGPQLLIHSNPSTGPGIPVGEAIVDELFAPGQTGRIPVAVLTGAEAESAAIAVEKMLRAAGRTPGLTCAAGKWVAGWRCTSEPLATTAAARDLLMSPEIDAAVFQLDWRSVAAEGMPLDRCDVLVLLDDDDLPEASDGGDSARVTEVDSRQAAMRALLRAVPPSGVVVVPAASRAAVAAAVGPGVGVIVLDEPGATATADMRSTGVRRVGLASGSVTCLEGGASLPVVAIADVAPTHADAVAGPTAILAAVATGLGLGLSRETIRNGLTIR
jgi:cyanophycin synthetase